MADFRAFPGIAMSLYVPLRQGTPRWLERCSVVVGAVGSLAAAFGLLGDAASAPLFPAPAASTADEAAGSSGCIASV
jgi:hypothetical protein